MKTRVVGAMILAAGLPLESMAQEAGGTRMTHLGTASTLGELLRHPAFAGFARRMLPWDDRSYDENLPLKEIGTLLPYHTQVDPPSTVAALNRMVDDVAAGSAVFHDIYTEAEMKRDPAKRNTALFYFRGRPGASFAVIAPGGGFAYVGSVHEGFPYASEISRLGYNAFVLKYRAGRGGEAATEDLAAALAYIFRNASRLGISTGGYSLWGSSAGARMAAAIGSHGTSPFGGGALPGPSTVVMAYTGHGDLVASEPPTFVVVGERDRIAPPSAMRSRVEALRAAGTAVEYHEYPDLGHGFGLGIGTAAEGWVAEAVRFWGQHGANSGRS